MQRTEECSTDEMLVFQAALEAVFNQKSNFDQFDQFMRELYTKLTGAKPETIIMSTPSEKTAFTISKVCDHVVQLIFFENAQNFKSDAPEKKFRDLVLKGVALAVKKWREQNPKGWNTQPTYLEGQGYSALSNFLKSTRAIPLGVGPVSRVLDSILPIIITDRSANSKNHLDWSNVWEQVQGLPPIYFNQFRHNFFGVISPGQRDEFSTPPLMQAIIELANDTPNQITSRYPRLRRYEQTNGWLGYWVPIVLIGLIIAYILALFIPATLERDDINAHRAFGTPPVSLLQVIEQTRQYIDPTYIRIILGFAVLFLLLFIFLIARTFYLYNPYQILP